MAHTGHKIRHGTTSKSVYCYKIQNPTPHLVVFLEYLSEAGEVECLVVLQQNQAQVELAERQLNVVHRLVNRLIIAALHRQLTDVTASHASNNGDSPRLCN